MRVFFAGQGLDKIDQAEWKLLAKKKKVASAKQTFWQRMTCIINSVDYAFYMFQLTCFIFEEDQVITEFHVKLNSNLEIHW